jgi:hypothetical protein
VVGELSGVRCEGEWRGSGEAGLTADAGAFFCDAWVGSRMLQNRRQKSLYALSAFPEGIDHVAVSLRSKAGMIEDRKGGHWISLADRKVNLCAWPDA